MTPRSDERLLRRYALTGSEEAFAALTRRYLDFVFAVCLRELGDRTLAEDVTQTVFLLLARKAGTLRLEDHQLGGWLFRVARYASMNARTGERRRQRREAALARSLPEATVDSSDTAVTAFLNDALASLSAQEQDWVFLRFGEGRSYAEIGALGRFTEDAARKRVTRAVDKLRRHLERQGVVITGAALALALSTGLAQPASAACLAGSALPAAVPLSPLAQGVLHTMRLMKLKTAVGLSVLAACGGYVAWAAAAQTGRTRPSPLSLKAAYPVLGGRFEPGAEADATLSAILVGHARYEDGRPAAGIPVAAQIQNDSLTKVDEEARRQSGDRPNEAIPYPPNLRKVTWNNTVTAADGSYRLPVAPGYRYNVMVFDTSGQWVAAALEGVQGRPNETVAFQDFTLTHGSLLYGTVKGAKGPSGTGVACYGPARPQTSAAVDSVAADASGRYVLRVAPGVNRVYTDGHTTQVVRVAPGQIQRVDLTAGAAR